MKKSLISLAVLAALGASSAVRSRTHDVAFAFRMGAGFAGEVNRTHPVSIYPAMMSTANPVRLYGDPGLYDAATNTFRAFLAGDGAVTKIAGVLVRPYPVQQVTGNMSQPLGAVVPPGGPAVIDVCEDGPILVRCNNFATVQPAKGGAVFVRIAATAGALIQGGFHSAADAANTVAIANAQWNGPADANGIAELIVWKA